MPIPSALEQQRFIEARQPFFAKVTEQVLKLVPKAVSIHCFGLNVVGPRISPSDWDFMVMLPESAPLSDIENLNRLTSPLAEFRKVGGQYLEVQVLREDDQTPCAALVRNEGVVIWAKGREGETLQ